MSDYKYKNLELKPLIFKEILYQLFDGKMFERCDAIKEVKDFHLNHGGVCNKDTYVGTFKAVTRKDKNIQNISHGVWKICTIDIDNQEIDMYKPQNKNNHINLNIKENIGEGDESVYVYYYPSYLELNKLKNQDTYPCKIGMTTVNFPLDRIYGQLTTSYPEYPIIGLLIKCNNAQQLEKLLHEFLKIKNKWLKDSPGKEWFLTNIEEIKEILNFINKGGE